VGWSTEGSVWFGNLCCAAGVKLRSILSCRLFFCSVVAQWFGLFRLPFRSCRDISPAVQDDADVASSQVLDRSLCDRDIRTPCALRLAIYSEQPVIPRPASPQRHR
jgi:hypothetical protein